MGISLVINRYQTIISLESILQLQIITVFEKAALEIVMSKKTVIQLQSRNPAASETLSEEFTGTAFGIIFGNSIDEMHKDCHCSQTVGSSELRPHILYESRHNR